MTSAGRQPGPERIDFDPARRAGILQVAADAGGPDTEQCSAAPIDVTIAIAGYNCEAFLEQAVASALAQEVALEVIIVDDASSDGTFALAERLAYHDARVRIIRMNRNGGPAAARNAALKAARGRWFAILDADDLMHPDRLRMLIASAEAEEADLIADDLIVFDDSDRKKPARFLTRHTAGGAEWITLASYLRSTRMYDSTPNLGYLKPIIRLSKLRESGIRYDERLRIGEDDHFIFAMLLAGFRYRLVAVAGYYYRKHSSSISHRLSPSTIDQIAAISAQMEQRMGQRSPAEKRAFDARARSVRRTTSFVHLLDHLKARAWSRAALEIFRNPSILPLLRQPPLDRLKRWIARRTYRPAPSRQILVVARQAQQALVRSVAAQTRLLGFKPVFLLVQEKRATILGAVIARLAPDTTQLPASYFDCQQEGRVLSLARLEFMRLSRQVERVMIIPPVPEPIAGELARHALPITRFDPAQKLDALLAAGSIDARRPSANQRSKAS